MIECWVANIETLRIIGNHVVFSGVERRDNTNRWRDEQVCPDYGQGIMTPWARRSGRRGSRKRSPALDGKKMKSPALDGERMRGEPWGWYGLEGSPKEKVLVRDWNGKEGKTMNAGGVENRI
ncbi:hypothetical protein TNCV_1668781 [Trichonephila clavipes]|nr:hypothetical protein TNCV_1668781 [Trichonephila clavipes]